MKNEIELSPSKESTKRNRLTTLSLLSKFKEQIDFNDLCPRMIYNFEKYLINLGFKNNTIAKHMKHLKQSINAAIDQSYISLNKHPFHRYRIKTTKGHHTYLLPEELKKLERLKLPQQHFSLKPSLEAFLFCCYTGIRYSDFIRLSEKNIIYIDEDPWIGFRSFKTGVETMLPIKLLFEGKAWKMLQRHRDNPTSFFNIKSNSSVNKELVRIGQLAGISKHFSFHAARHTNATLLIYNGANITTVQKLLGHKKISTTQIYSEVMRTTIVKDLKKCMNH
jgi:site-specific recombinase XerD